MKRNIILGVSGLIVIVGLYVAANTELPLQNQLEEKGSGVAAVYGLDFDNPRILVGDAQEVFAAKVLAETGNAPQTLPTGAQLARFQYDVEVLYNIKGNANGRIQVDLEAFEGARLTVGGTYVLAAWHWNETGPWYYVGSPGAFRVLVSENSRLANEELIELVKKHARTYELLNAYPNEILQNNVVGTNRAVNSFQSLSESGRQAIFNKFSELIPPRPVPEILPPPPPPQETTETSGSSCRDGRDNDSDGLVDRKDPDCLVYYREDKPSFCKDNIDNDLDSLKDAQDPDCAQFYPPAPVPPPPTAPLPPENFAPPPPTPTSTPPASAPTSTEQ